MLLTLGYTTRQHGKMKNAISMKIAFFISRGLCWTEIERVLCEFIANVYL